MSFLIPSMKIDVIRCALQPATSLGGVESLIEQRYQVFPEFDPKMLRISVGVEHLEVRKIWYSPDIHHSNFILF